LKKKIEKGELRPQNCNEAHWEQLTKVLMQEENVDRAIQMTKVQATQKNVHLDVGKVVTLVSRRRWYI
jgi:hypothetical protein